MLGHYIAAHDYNSGAPAGALGPCEPARAMHFEERRKLSAHLTNLPNEKLQGVIEIVEAGVAVSARVGGLEGSWLGAQWLWLKGMALFLVDSALPSQNQSRTRTP